MRMLQEDAAHVTTSVLALFLPRCSTLNAEEARHESLEESVEEIVLGLEVGVEGHRRPAQLSCKAANREGAHARAVDKT